MGSPDTTVTNSDKTPDRIGKFRLLEPLGRGGMGVVFRAYDEEKNDIVALKLMQSDPLISASGQTERFRREGASLHKLTHPNIVPVVSIGEADGYHYIALELIDGGSLASVDPAKLSPQRKLEIARDIARALAYAHENGVVHRDVKPGNILLRRDGTAVLTDFGLARDESRMTRLTQSIALLGTPAYMSPEQAQGVSTKVGAPSDIWSLGVVLYELLSGRLPFDALDVDGLVARIRDAEPNPILSVAPETPPHVAEVVTRAMRRDPEERYASARVFAEDLDRLIRGERPVGTRDPFRTRVWRAFRRHRGRTAACGAAAVLLGATGIFGGPRGPTPEARRLGVAEAVHRIFEREAKPLQQTVAKLDERTPITAALETMQGDLGAKPNLDDIRSGISAELQTQMLTTGVATVFYKDLSILVSRGPRDDQGSVVPVYHPTAATVAPGDVITFPRKGEAWIVSVAPLHAPGEKTNEVGWAAVGAPFPLEEASSELKRLGAAARWRSSPANGVTFGDPAVAAHLSGEEIPASFKEAGLRYQTFETKAAEWACIVAVPAPVRPPWVIPLSLAACSAGALLLLLALFARRGVSSAGP